MVFSNILVAYDGSDHAKKALETARRFALEDADVQLRLLTVVFPADVDPGMYYDGTMGPDVESLELDQEMDKAAQKHALDQLHQAAVLDGVAADRVTCDIQVLPSAADAIAAYAADHGCDLIIVGRHSKKGILDFLGSTAKAVMRKTTLPVLTVE